ncbi:MAG: FadR/GntR family transcriptional regulator [Cellvibrio sp.]
MELKAIKTDRLYIKVADQLTRLIAEGVFAVGDRLPSERDLAEQLNVSRPTIREAMIALELSGIVNIRTGSGIYVQQKPARLEWMDRGVGPFEILEARLLIETEVCALAATRISDAQLDRLSATLMAMTEAQTNHVSSQASDWEFHRLIAEASQNTALVSIVDWLWQLRAQSELSRAFMKRLEQEGIHPSIAEHGAILDALRARNSALAKQAMHAHLINSTQAAAHYFDKL